MVVVVCVLGVVAVVVVVVAVAVDRIRHARRNSQDGAPHTDVDTSHRATQETNKLRMRAKEARGARKKKKRMIRKEAMGGHNLSKQADGRWRCGACRRASKRWDYITPQKCSGAAANARAEVAKLLRECNLSAGLGHTRMKSGESIWCGRCGAYGLAKGISIRQPCTSDPKRLWTESGTLVLNTGRKINLLLLKGRKHPDTGLPPPAVPEAQWNTYPIPVLSSTPAGGGGTSSSKPRADILSKIRPKEAGGVDSNSVLGRPSKFSRLEVAITPIPPPPTATPASALKPPAPVTRESLVAAATVAQRRTQGIAGEAGLNEPLVRHSPARRPTAAMGLNTSTENGDSLEGSQPYYA